MAKPYVTFLIDSTGVIAGSISKSPDPRQPDVKGELKVIYAGGRVTVIAWKDKLTRVIASARWRAGQLDRRTVAKDETRLSDFQWNLLRASLAQHVDGVRPEKLRPERAKAAREVVSNSPLELDEPSATFKAVLWGTMAVIMVLAFVLSYTCTKKDEPATVAATPAPAPAAVTPRPAPSVPEEPVEVRIMKAPSFAEAIALAKPAMSDTADELGPGSRLFATYAASKLRWEDLDVPAETTFGHVFKDPEVERGKRMCAEGVILDIERRDLGPRKIYVGTLRASASEMIAFVAVGTTGELVRTNTARFCGAVIGRVEHSASMVGMFDLPENRTPIVEQ